MVGRSSGFLDKALGVATTDRANSVLYLAPRKMPDVTASGGEVIHARSFPSNAQSYNPPQDAPPSREGDVPRRGSQPPDSALAHARRRQSPTAGSSAVRADARRQSASRRVRRADVRARRRSRGVHRSGRGQPPGRREAESATDAALSHPGRAGSKFSTLPTGVAGSGRRHLVFGGRNHDGGDHACSRAAKSEGDA